MIAIVAALPGELSAIEAGSAEGPLTTRRVAGRELHAGTSAGGPAAEVVIGEHGADLAALGLGAPHWHLGTIASGDTFVVTAEDSTRLRHDLPGTLAVEMEGAAIGQVCRTAAVPFAVARTISDRADGSAVADFPKFLDRIAARYARDLVLTALPWCP